MKTTLTAFALAAAVALPGALRADDIQTAAQGLAACAQVFPDGKKAAKAYKSMGFASQGDVQGVTMYSAGAVSVATSATKGQPLRCMATTAGMTVPQAKALAQSVLPLLQGAKDTGIRMGGIEQFWTGKMNGKSAGIVVAAPTNDGLGASVTIVLN